MAQATIAIAPATNPIKNDTIIPLINLLLVWCEYLY